MGKNKNSSSSSKRHSKQGKNKKALDRVTKPVIRRLARRGGVRRISNQIYEEVRLVIEKYLDKVVADSVIYTEHARRKTIQSCDVKRALSKNGRTLYGA
jgi:histone H4